jgi:putative membrane protein insertion efficiency factor
MIAKVFATAVSMGSRTIKFVLLCLIAIWQKSLGPLLGPRCRFYPSCSQYTKESIEKQPLVKALAKSMLRLLKCHPFHPGGIDQP